MSLQDFTNNRAVFSSIDLHITQKPRFFLTSTTWRPVEQQHCRMLCTVWIPTPFPVKARKVVVKERWGSNPREERTELLVTPFTGRKVNYCLCWPVHLHPDKQGNAHFCCVHRSVHGVSVHCSEVEPANPQSRGRASDLYRLQIFQKEASVLW